MFEFKGFNNKSLIRNDRVISEIGDQEREAQPNRCMYFDGSGWLVSIKRFDIVNVGEVSSGTFWFKVDEQQVNYGTVLGVYFNGPVIGFTQDNYVFTTDSYTKLIVGNDDGSGRPISSKSYTGTGWNFWYWEAKREKELKIFINDELVLHYESTGIYIIGGLNNGYNLQNIGGNTNAKFYKGYLYDFRTFRLKTLNEVEYQKVKRGEQINDSEFHNYKLDEGIGNIAYNSVDGYAGSIQGGSSDISTVHVTDSDLPFNFHNKDGYNDYPIALDSKQAIKFAGNKSIYEIQNPEIEFYWYFQQAPFYNSSNHDILSIGLDVNNYGIRIYFSNADSLVFQIYEGESTYTTYSYSGFIGSGYSEGDLIKVYFKVSEGQIYIDNTAISQNVNTTGSNQDYDVYYGGNGVTGIGILNDTPNISSSPILKDVKITNGDTNEILFNSTLQYNDLKETEIVNKGIGDNAKLITSDGSPFQYLKVPKDPNSGNDVLGQNLQYEGSIKYPVKFVESNCLEFDGNTQIEYPDGGSGSDLMVNGKDGPYEVEFWANFTNSDNYDPFIEFGTGSQNIKFVISGNDIEFNMRENDGEGGNFLQKHELISDLNYNEDYKIKLYADVRGTTKEIYAYLNDELKFSLKEEFFGRFGGGNEYLIIGGSNNGQLKGKLWDIKITNPLTNEKILYLPLSEGGGSAVHNIAKNAPSSSIENQIETTNDYTNLWKFQNKVHYNLLNGYRREIYEYSDSDFTKLVEGNNYPYFKVESIDKGFRITNESFPLDGNTFGIVGLPMELFQPEHGQLYKVTFKYRANTDEDYICLVEHEANIRRSASIFTPQKATETYDRTLIREFDDTASQYSFDFGIAQNYGGFERYMYIGDWFEVWDLKIEQLSYIPLKEDGETDPYGNTSLNRITNPTDHYHNKAETKLDFVDNKPNTFNNNLPNNYDISLDYDNIFRRKINYGYDNLTVRDFDVHNALKFDGSVHTYLPNENPRGDKITCWFKLDSSYNGFISTVASGDQFGNDIPFNAIIGFENGKIVKDPHHTDKTVILYDKNKIYNDNNWHYLEIIRIENSDSPIGYEFQYWVNKELSIRVTGNTALSSSLSLKYVGSRSQGENSLTYFTYRGYIVDIRLYDGNQELIRYPFSEGAGDYIHNIAKDQPANTETAQIITNSDLTGLWTNDQRIYYHNFEHGKVQTVGELVKNRYLTDSENIKLVYWTQDGSQRIENTLTNWEVKQGQIQKIQPTKQTQNEEIFVGLEKLLKGGAYKLDINFENFYLEVLNFNTLYNSDLTFTYNVIDDSYTPIWIDNQNNNFETETPTFLYTTTNQKTIRGFIPKGKKLTGVDFTLPDDAVDGSLDLTDIPLSKFDARNNSLLTSVTTEFYSVECTSFRFNQSQVTSFDTTKLNFSGLIQLQGNLQDLTLGTNNKEINTVYLNGQDFQNSLDFSGWTNLNNATFWISDSANLPSIILPYGNFNNLRVDGLSSVNQDLDLTGRIFNNGFDLDAQNSNFTDFLTDILTGDYGTWKLDSNNLSGTKDYSNWQCGFDWLNFFSNPVTYIKIPNVTRADDLYFHDCSQLENVDLPTVNGVVTNNFWAYNTNLSTNNYIFPLGQSIQASNIQIQNNNFNQSTVDANIDNLYQNAYTGGTLNIAGNNAEPSFLTKINQIKPLTENDNWTITFNYEVTPVSPTTKVATVSPSDDLITFDNGIDFRNIDEYGEIQNISGLEVNSPFVFSMWYRLYDIPTTTNATFISGYDSGDSNNLFKIELEDYSGGISNHKIKISISNGSGGFETDSILISNYTADDIIHFVLRIDSNDPAIFVNTEKYPLNTSTFGNTIAKFITGGMVGTDGNAVANQMENCVVDEMWMVENQTPTDNDIEEIYKGGIGTNYPNSITSTDIIFWYQFNSLDSSDLIIDQGTYLRNLAFNNTLPNLVSFADEPEVALTYETDFQGTYDPTINENKSNDFTPIWEDNLGNSVQANKPNFSYGDTSTKTITVKLKRSAKYAYAFNFLGNDGGPYYMKGIFDLSEVNLRNLVDVRINPITDLIFGYSKENINEVAIGGTDNFPSTYNLDLSLLKNVNYYNLGPLKVQKITFPSDPIVNEVQFNLTSTPFGITDNGLPNLDELINFTSFNIPLKSFIYNAGNYEAQNLTSFDLSNFTEVRGDIDIRQTNYLTTISLPPENVNVTGVYDIFIFNASALSGTLDLRFVNQGGLGNQSNPNIDTVLLPTTSGLIDTFNFWDYPLITELDVSGMTNITDDFNIYDNTSLSNVILMQPGEADNIPSLDAHNCNLSTQDFKIGLVFKQGRFDLTDNNMDQFTVDLNIDNIYQNESNIISGKDLRIAGSNSEPSGIYQESPTPTSGAEKIYALINTYGWTVVFNYNGVTQNSNDSNFNPYNVGLALDGDGVNNYASGNETLPEIDLINNNQTFAYWVYNETNLADNDLIFELIDSSTNSRAIALRYKSFTLESDDGDLADLLTPNSFKNEGSIRYQAIDKISLDVNNWLVYDNGSHTFPGINSNRNDLTTSDTFTFNQISYLGGSSIYNPNSSRIGTFMIFQPELTQSQHDWLYNNGNGLNDPISQEAKNQGIGVYGVDTLSGTITTLLVRYVKFNDLYVDSSGNEFVKEEIIDNDQYAQLYNYQIGSGNYKLRPINEGSTFLPDVEILSFNTNRNGTFNPTINDITGTIAPFWKDSVGNQIETNSPNFNYSDGSSKTVKVYEPKYSLPGFSVDFKQVDNSSSRYINGSLDLSNVFLRNTFDLSNQHQITDITFNQTDNTYSFSDIEIDFSSGFENTNITSLDFSWLQGAITNQFRLRRIPNLNSLTIGNNSNNIILADINNVGDSTLVPDFSGWTNVSVFNYQNSSIQDLILPTINNGDINLNPNSSLSQLTFQSSSTINKLLLNGCNISDPTNMNNFSNITVNSGATIFMNNNPFTSLPTFPTLPTLSGLAVGQNNISSWVAPSIPEITTNLYLRSTSATSFDLSAISLISGDVRLYANNNLIDFTSPGSVTGNIFNIRDCDLGNNYDDIAYVVLPLGSQITSNEIYVQDNRLHQDAVNLTVDSLYQNAYNNGILNIAGNNQEPSGVYQESPTPTSGAEKIYELIHTHGWTITFNYQNETYTLDNTSTDPFTQGFALTGYNDDRKAVANDSISEFDMATENWTLLSWINMPNGFGGDQTLIQGVDSSGDRVLDLNTNSFNLQDNNGSTGNGLNSIEPSQSGSYTTLSINNNGINLYGFSKITNDTANWKTIGNDLSESSVSLNNDFVDGDSVSLNNIHFINAPNIYNPLDVDNRIGSLMLFSPEITDSQQAWLYNNGEGRDPTSQDAKSQGIGVYGVDTLDSQITTLLYRYVRFNDLFTDSSGNEFIKEEINDNDQYAQLQNYFEGKGGYKLTPFNPNVLSVKDVEFLTYTTDFNGTYDPTINDTTNTITPIWTDSLNNRVQANTPNFNYSTSNDKTIYVYKPKYSLPNFNVIIENEKVKNTLDVSNMYLNQLELSVNSNLTYLEFGDMERYMDLFRMGNTAFSGHLDFKNTSIRDCVVGASNGITQVTLNQSDDIVNRFNIGSDCDADIDFTGVNLVNAHIRFNFIADHSITFDSSSISPNELRRLIIDQNVNALNNFDNIIFKNNAYLDIESSLNLTGVSGTLIYPPFEAGATIMDRLQISDTGINSHDFTNFPNGININVLSFQSNAETGTHDTSNIGDVQIYQLTDSVIKSSGVTSINEPNSVTSSFNVFNVGTLSQTFNFGTNITASTIDIYDNNLSQADVDANINELYTNVYSGGTLDISGNNAEPSGFYQNTDPPTTGAEQIYALIYDHGWTIRFNYNGQIYNFDSTSDDSALFETAISFNTEFDSTYKPRFEPQGTDTYYPRWSDTEGNSFTDSYQPSFLYNTTSSKTITINKPINNNAPILFAPADANDGDNNESGVYGTLDLSNIVLDQLESDYSQDINSISFNTTQTHVCTLIKLARLRLLPILDLTNFEWGGELNLALSNGTLNEIQFTGHSNEITKIDLREAALNVAHDFSTLTNFNGIFELTNSSGLPSINFPNGSFDLLYVDGLSSLSQSFDFSGRTLKTNGKIQVVNCSFTSLTFPTLSGTYDEIQFNGADLSGAVDLTNLTGDFNRLVFIGMNNVTSYDLSGFSSTDDLIIETCNSLESVTLPSTNNSVTTVLRASNCNFNVTDYIFPLGTVIQATTIELQNNGYNQADIDSTIDQLYQNTYTGGTLNIAGDNAEPSGFYQDSQTPSTGSEKLYELINNHSWTVTFNYGGTTHTLDSTSDIPYEVVNYGLVGDGIDNEAKSTNILNLGTDNFSIFSWVEPDSATGGSQIILSGTENNDNRFEFYIDDLTPNFYIFRSTRQGSIDGTNDLNAGQINAYGVQKISNDVTNWDIFVNGNFGSTTDQFNDLLSGDNVEIHDVSFLSFNLNGNLHFDGRLYSLFIFQPELTTSQFNWLYNNGLSKDPTSSEAKAQGIGVQGVDTLDSQITTLLIRDFRFESIDTDSLGNEYIREEITNDNQYAQLGGYGTGDDRLRSFKE